MKKYLTLKNLGWVLTAAVVFLLGMSGVSKVIATDEMVKNFDFMKLTPYMALIGVLEIASIGLLVYPKTSIYGAVLASSLMSGAVALHLSLMGGTGFLMPIIIGLLAWSGHCLRTYSTCEKK